jgi:hypothetical protein
MHLNIHIKGKPTIAVQLFDHLYAYSQQLNQHKNFTSEFKITLTEKKNIVLGAVNILVQYMPNSPVTDLEEYDLVLLDNADEPLEVSTEIMYDLLHKLHTYPQVYLLANAVLSSDHPLHLQVIPTISDGGNFRDYHARPFYPQYYTDTSSTNNRKNLIYINGQNRANRHHMLSLLAQQIPDLEIKSNITPGIISELNDCFYESSEDSQFREWVNTHYSITRNQKLTYYDNSIMCGIDQKFGSIAPGYFAMKEYFDYCAVIFPDTAWINNELCITEKSLKCFYAKSLPWPVSGAGVNQLYNQMGFYTVWNLLPDKLQQYDNEKNHQTRYIQIAIAVKYVHDNPELLKSKLFDQYVDSNYIKLHTYKFALPGVKKLLKILEKHERRY